MHILKGLVAITCIAFATIGVCSVLFVWYVQLLLTPAKGKGPVRAKLDRIIVWWTQANRWMIKRLHLLKPQLHWQGRENFSPEHWYLVVSNHQTWADILILQTYLLDDVPPLKFFTKSQLIWLPLLGPAMYALGFPYVKRVSREQIKKNPELRHADRDNIFKVCEGFKNHPTSILNFAEGTRRTDEKLQRQNGQFQHLLNPKPGGITYLLEGMGSQLHGVVDVTLVYPDGVPTFWDFLQGKSQRVVVDIRHRDLPNLEANDDAAGSANPKSAQVARWVQSLWAEKDSLISGYLGADGTTRS
jgi:1-acyl-sn-glycerol-3-phosphate acyltransferase